MQPHAAATCPVTTGRSRITRLDDHGEDHGHDDHAHDDERAARPDRRVAPGAPGMLGVG